MNKHDFSKLGFNSYQSIDLEILMDLKSLSEIQEWMAVVGKDDVDYGINLLQTACEMQKLDDIDFVVDRMTPAELTLAQAAIAKAQ
jgi:hypothetical protein